VVRHDWLLDVECSHRGKAFRLKPSGDINLFPGVLEHVCRLRHPRDDVARNPENSI
jgi:hypothetical protein